MGAWRTDSFDNDVACDWKYDLEEKDDLDLVDSTLEEPLEQGEEYLDSDFCCAAIAACEVPPLLHGVSRRQKRWRRLFGGASRNSAHRTNTTSGRKTLRSIRLSPIDRPLSPTR